MEALIFFWGLEFWNRFRASCGEGFLGQEELDGKRFFDDLAQMLARFDVAEGERLDEDVADGGGLDRTGDDLHAGGIGGELVEELAAAAAADDVEFLDLMADEAFERAEGFGVSQREAFQIVRTNWPGVAGASWPVSRQKAAILCGMSPGERKRASSEGNVGLGGAVFHGEAR